ncbi:germinal-center associated nuclear protein [Hyperolius riggenbachi]|uniref:germinal-center associated nuclear protein n=1 Tax=Hyperolius riggenbachi TaxID=752182 RepID=UPI0035A2970C
MMNSNNPFGGPQAPGTTSQSTGLFGQTSAFGQTASGLSAPSFGQSSPGQSSSVFGQLSTSQPASVFGQSTPSQTPAFGQTASVQSLPSFGQTNSGFSAPVFGQVSSGPSVPAFGQSGPAFGQVASGQSGPLFGQGTSGQPGSVFGQSSTAQSSSVFGQSTSGQSGSVFGQTSSAQSSSMFGQSTSTQSGSIFGKTTSSGQTGPMFGQASSGQSSSVFGQAASGQSGVIFGQTSSGPSASVFGQGSTGQSGSVFGQSSSGQSAPAFGQGTSVFGQANPGQSVPAFGQSPAFGLGTTGQPAPAFGQSSANQSTPAFGQSLPAFGQTNPNQPSLFGQVSSTQSTSPFAQATTTQSSTLFTQPSNSQSSLFSSNANQTASAFSQAVTSQSSVSFGGSTSAFGQTVPGSSAFEQLPKQSQGESSQGSVFGQSSQTPLFGQSTAGKSLGQTANTQSEQDASRQNVAFGQAATGQSSQTSAFGQLSSTQPLSAQTTTFGTLPSTQTGKASVFGENSEKMSVFGPPPPYSSSGQNKNVGLAFGVTSQLSSGSNVSDSKLSSSLMPSPFGQMSSISSANTAFKPVLPGSGKTQEAMDKPFFGNPASSGLERSTRSLFSFNADKQLKDGSGSSRPQFANTDSSFPSISEDTGREESLKSMKRKEDTGNSPYKHDLAPFDDAATDLQSEHPPVKRPPRRTRELQGGANLLVRSLYDVVKSHIKTQQKVEPKKEEELESQFSDPDAPVLSQAAAKSIPSESSQARSTKMQPPAVAIQPTQSKPHPFGSQGAPSRISVVAPSQQAPSRELSFAGPSQQVSVTIRPLLDEQDLPRRSEAPVPKTPLRRARRSDSTDSLTSVSPNELTTLQLKGLPKHLNTKKTLNQFFGKFGRILQSHSRPANMSAIITFTQHKNALAAKKAIKSLHKDVSAFWLRKKGGQNKESPFPSRENKPGQRMEMQAEQKSAIVAMPAIPPLLPGLKASPQKKPQFSKALQFDVDNTAAMTATPDVPALSLPPSVMQLVGMVAETSEERYRLLDQRDRILRQARVKRTELDQAKPFAGTCTDMCPEKERYMRDTRNQLSIYELLPGTDKIDHAAAIKEYSRSSADQEEPLPHELRPLPVLCMTMDYLVTYIMDHGENNYRDWYDFVWNRTRGIRKDITQQHLCDPVTASLMEKCMRFHIHCAYELCEESLSLFDPKINNENLTKCLQSLKEMYQDLENRGETCPCESEFRGYSVLLNLNKGDILREVQQFRESVRNSAEVKFAVQVFSAFSSSNYVRFFKLVHSTTYLNSCILHGYFTQIRRTALRTLNIAYTVSPQRSSLFPLEEMVRLLMFQDADQAATFLTAYGLNVSDGLVELNRLAFAEPEVPLQSTKSLFISQKRQVSVGEVVNGALLPIFSAHVPVCSFDAQNRYTGVTSPSEGTLKAGQEAAVPVIADRPEVSEAKSEEKSIKRTIILVQDSQEPPSSSIPAQSVFQPIMLPEAPPSPPKPTITDEDVAAVLDEILDDIVKGFSVDVSQTAAAYVSAALGESSLVADRLLTDVTSDMFHTISKEELKAETRRVEEEKQRKAEEDRRIQEREQLLSKLSQSECDDLLQQVLQENIRTIASENLREAIQADHKARISRCSQHISDKFVYDFVEEELDRIAKEILYEMQLSKKYFQRWREVLAARKKLRRQMRGFPAAPGLMGNKGTLKALIPSAVHTLHNQSKGIVDLGHAGKMFVSVVSPQQRTEQNLHKMKVQHIFRELLCDAAWSPLDVPSMIVKTLPSWKNCIFWKVVLALPEISQLHDLNSLLSDWLKAKFSWAGIQLTDDQNPQVQTLAVYNTLQSQEGWPVSINVAVKTVHGPLTDSELDDAEYQNELWGTSSLVLLLPFQSEQTDEYWISAMLQLKQLLNTKPFKPAPSLAVLLPGNCPDAEQKVEEELGLLDLVSCDLISDYIVVSIPETVTNMKGTEKVTSAVQFLLSRSPNSPQLHALPFQQYIEDGVYRLFSDSFYYDMSKRRKHGLPSQDPSAIIDFYNSAIAFLAEGVSLSKLGELSWPMTEFTSSKGSFVMPPMDWNSLEHLAWLKKAILSFQVPQMDKPPEGAPWHLVCSMIEDYVSQICKSSEALPVLDSEIQMLLEGAWKHCLDQKAAEESNVELFVQEIPWDDLVALCVNHKLREWNPPFSTCDKGSLEDLYVYFFEEDLEHFGMPETWIKACLNTDKEVLAASESFPCKRKRTVQLPRTGQSLSHEAKTQKGHENRKSLASSLSFFQLSDTQENESFPSKKKHTSESPPAAESSFVANAENTQKQLDDLKSYQLRLQRALLVEKQESERFNEKLQQMLEEEPLDVTLSLPQYLTNTSLPGALESAIVSPSPKSPSIFGTSLSFSRPESATGSRSHSPSLKELMNSLQTSIKKYRDEDIALNLHFCTLLDVGEPSSPP